MRINSMWFGDVGEILDSLGPYCNETLKQLESIGADMFQGVVPRFFLRSSDIYED
jgi:hypothetical protein